MAPEIQDLWWKVRVCQRFPAYRLDDLDGVGVAELMRAMQLLAIHDQAQRANSG